MFFLVIYLLSWSFKRQATLFRSSVKAEYCDIINIVFGSCWLHNLLLELLCPIHKTTITRYDNVNIIYIFRNLIQHQHTKHIKKNINFIWKKIKVACEQILHVTYAIKLWISSQNIFLNTLSRFSGIYKNLPLYMHGCEKICL